MIQHVVKPEPPAHYDWSNFDADYYHLNGLIRAGRNRSLAVNDPICNVCVEGYEFVRDGIHPNAIPCRNCGKLRKALNRLLTCKSFPTMHSMLVYPQSISLTIQINKVPFHEIMNWDRYGISLPHS